MGVDALPGAATDAGMQVASNVINGKEWNGMILIMEMWHLDLVSVR